MNEQLTPLRDRIDSIDEEVLRLLNERARLAQEIGHIKNGPIYRAEREAQVIRRLQAANEGPLPPESISVLYKEIMSACRALEQPLSVAYLGPQGTFSEAAAVKHFGHAVTGVPCADIDAAFRAVERGAATFSVAPVENSTEGAVNRTLDLLLSSPLRICGEVKLRIRQHLMRSVEGMQGIEVVYSHAQSLGQCHEWLGQNLYGVKTIRTTSNAEAARLAAENPNAAAIAGELAAEHYDLKIIARDIEDEPNNTTRFLVLGNEDAAPSGRDKTSLVLSAKNRPGSLLELLAPLAGHNIGLTKLESRPARKGGWDYVFYMDIDGHRNDTNIQNALSAVEEHCTFLKVLGSYPVAV
ncbi:MAG: prephenate dehydratase [Pseudomonadota bacterium]|nr:prephenate dehydratase [Pseudomonadota bacterium]MDP1905401.1 prephenate dehydratase [Pseudomonadota bacterium]MDP2354143.1 prephenate dehydratase [Pseudomonadota bacterium]